MCLCCNLLYIRPPLTAFGGIMYLSNVISFYKDHIRPASFTNSSSSSPAIIYLLQWLDSHSYQASVQQMSFHYAKFSSTWLPWPFLAPLSLPWSDFPPLNVSVIITRQLTSPVTFDALLPCPNNTAISLIVCNIRCVRGIGEHIGCLWWWPINLLLLQIVNYQLNIHLPSLIQHDHEFTFLGKITFMSYVLWHMQLPWSWQSPFRNATSTCHSTSIFCKFTFCGHVLLFKPDHLGFVITLCQYMPVDMPVGMLTIHVTLLTNQARLTLNQCVTCTRELLTVKLGEPVCVLDQIVNVDWQWLQMTFIIITYHYSLLCHCFVDLLKGWQSNAATMFPAVFSHVQGDLRKID